MAQAVILPKLGQQTVESTIVKWHKKTGDKVKKGDVLFEMETDKAVLEAESFFEGTLLKVFVHEGTTVPVNTVVAYIGTPGEAVPDTPPPPPPSEASVAAATPAAAPAAPVAPAAPRPAHAQAVAPASPAIVPAAVSPTPTAPAPSRRLVISPRARALATACVIDPALIVGSGPNGRIVEKDVRTYLQQHGYDRLRITPAAKQQAAKAGLDILTIRGTGEGGRIGVRDVERSIAERPKAMSKMRQVIAARLTQSFTSTPHFFVTVSADLTDLLALRKDLNARGGDYSVTDFILEAVILGLQDVPEMNSVTDGRTVTWHGSVHLGVAVALENGLVVPVVRDADQLSLAELHDRTKDLVGKARKGTLLPDEMSGSTFTVSNMGMLGVENFTAIINPGEAGILAVSATIPTPVVRDAKVVVRSMMKMTVSADHRVVDGMKATLFVNAIKNKLEDMELWKRLTSW
jgi:pyruvate dehydrogenase E2 component (dihydrolipoamide acetyltransferase)